MPTFFLFEGKASLVRPSKDLDYTSEPRARTHRRVDTVFVTFGMHWTGLSSPFTHTCIHIPPSTNPQEEEGGWEGGRGLVEGGREGRASGRGWCVGGFLGGGS